MEKKTYSINYWNILCLIFITLKLCKVINWSWWWILCPLWIQFVIAIITLLALKIYEFFSESKLYRNNVLLNGTPIHWNYKTKQMYDNNGNVIEVGEINDEE